MQFLLEDQLLTVSGYASKNIQLLLYFSNILFPHICSIYVWIILLAPFFSITNDPSLTCSECLHLVVIQEWRQTWGLWGRTAGRVPPLGDTARCKSLTENNSREKQSRTKKNRLKCTFWMFLFHASTQRTGLELFLLLIPIHLFFCWWLHVRLPENYSDRVHDHDNDMWCSETVELTDMF